MGGKSHCQDQLYNFRVKCKIRMEGLWGKKEFISVATGEATEAEGMAVESKGRVIFIILFRWRKASES